MMSSTDEHTATDVMCVCRIDWNCIRLNRVNSERKNHDFLNWRKRKKNMSVVHCFIADRRTNVKSSFCTRSSYTKLGIGDRGEPESERERERGADFYMRHEIENSKNIIICIWECSSLPNAWASLLALFLADHICFLHIFSIWVGFLQIQSTRSTAESATDRPNVPGF